MYVHLNQAMEFEWDAAKSAKTDSERGIGFEYASTVFYDDDRVVWLSRTVKGEERFGVIGRTWANEVLFVVYTWRKYEQDEPVCRIISARKANQKERRRYPRVHELS